MLFGADTNSDQNRLLYPDTRTRNRNRKGQCFQEKPLGLGVLQKPPLLNIMNCVIFQIHFLSCNYCPQHLPENLIFIWIHMESKFVSGLAGAFLIGRQRKRPEKFFDWQLVSRVTKA